MFCSLRGGNKTCQLMDYYDLIEYVAERSWLEEMLSMTPITSPIDLIVTLASSCHKEPHLRCCRVHAVLFEILIKTIIVVWVMISTTSFCLDASQAARLGSSTRSSALWGLNQNLLIRSQNLNPLGYFLLDYLFNMGLLLAVIQTGINTF